MSQLTYSVTQSIAPAGALLIVKQQCKKSMFCWVPWHGKEIINIRFCCGEKNCCHCLNKTHNWIVKQVGEVLKCLDAMSPTGRVAQ